MHYRRLSQTRPEGLKPKANRAESKRIQFLGNEQQASLPHQLVGLCECCELPQRGSGRANQRSRFWYILGLGCKNHHFYQHKIMTTEK